MTNPPNTLNFTECNQLFLYFENRTHGGQFDYNRHRDLLMFLLMLDAGLRVSEVSQLLISDLYAFGQVVESLRIRAEISKSQHARTIPLSIRTRCVTSALWVKGWSGWPEPLAQHAFRCGVSPFRITTRTIERIIGRASAASIGRHITPHWLRHTFASRLMRTTNIRVVQALLGHRSLQSTQVYTHPDANDLKSAISGMQ